MYMYMYMYMCMYMYMYMCMYVYMYTYMYLVFVCQCRAVHSESLSAPGGGLAAQLLSDCLFLRPGQETKFSFILCGRSQVVSEAGAWSCARPEPFLKFPYLSLLCFASSSLISSLQFGNSSFIFTSLSKHEFIT